jgi:hypothetical protein
MVQRRKQRTAPGSQRELGGGGRNYVLQCARVRLCYDVNPKQSTIRPKERIGLVSGCCCYRCVAAFVAWRLSQSRQATRLARSCARVDESQAGWLPEAPEAICRSAVASLPRRPQLVESLSFAPESLPFWHVRDAMCDMHTHLCRTMSDCPSNAQTAESSSRQVSNMHQCRTPGMYILHSRGDKLADVPHSQAIMRSFRTSILDPNPHPKRGSPPLRRSRARASTPSPGEGCT